MVACFPMCLEGFQLTLFVVPFVVFLCLNKYSTIVFPRQLSAESGVLAMAGASSVESSTSDSFARDGSTSCVLVTGFENGGYSVGSSHVVFDWIVLFLMDPCSEYAVFTPYLSNAAYSLCI